MNFVQVLHLYLFSFSKEKIKVTKCLIIMLFMFAARFSLLWVTSSGSSLTFKFGHVFGMYQMYIFMKVYMYMHIPVCLCLCIHMQIDFFSYHQKFSSTSGKAGTLIYWQRVRQTPSHSGYHPKGKFFLVCLLT